MKTQVTVKNGASNIRSRVLNISVEINKYWCLKDIRKLGLIILASRNYKRLFQRSIKIRLRKSEFTTFARSSTPHRLTRWQKRLQNKVSVSV